jgi:hypothetical protein
MPRSSFYLMVAAGVAALLAQSCGAQAHWCRAARGYCHHHHVSEAQWRVARETIDAIAHSAFYGPFGGYEDAAAASRYSGPNERRYFGYGRTYGYGPDRG